MGRHTEYTEEMAGRICEMIADGKSLRSICLLTDMPVKSTVFKWLTQNQSFADQYAHARDAQADVIFDEILDIADEEVTMVRAGKHKPGAGDDEQVEVIFDSTAVQRNRLRVDARKWMAGKLRPKVYGEKQSLEHTGPDGGPIELTHTVSAATLSLLEDLSRIGADSGSETPVQD